MSFPADHILSTNRRRLLGASVLAALTSVTADPAQAEPPRADPMRPLPVPPQAPAKEGIAEVAGTRLWYWDTGGTGTPIVLMHPASGSALTWPYQQPTFAAAGYRVVAYSRRGYYNSDPVPAENPGSAANDLNELANFLQLGRFHIVATAGGCAFSNDYALSHPQRVRSMVLSSGLGGEQDADYLAITETLTPKGYRDMPVTFRELGPSYRAANPEGTRQWAERTAKAVTGERRGQKLVNKITWEAFSHMQTPVLLIAGDADLNAPPALARMFAARIPHNETAFIPEAGHSAHWEQPDVFNRIVLDFIGRH